MWGEFADANARGRRSGIQRFLATLDPLWLSIVTGIIGVAGIVWGVITWIKMLREDAEDD
ncbi:hypothetical protein [Klugiella xanthotipulae]|uniref:Uncharacterized protein n=1 Tax=Klugiella xanthotipulae TaxID=244735 RepID=A0A543HZ09_9MICO|nr:hypothetical protein [Klugiella xanthotipulae]TQM63549.1 hypothetical protein FB466_1815 [Klugiella xanthotipulae]